MTAITTDKHEAMTAALNELDSLEREQAGFDAAMAEAVRAGDGKQALKVRRRQDDLATLISAARVRYLKAKIAWLEDEQAEAETVLQPLSVAKQEADAALEQAKQAQQQAFLVWDHARVGSHALRQELGTAKRELDAVVNEGSINRGPLVRSKIHA